MYTSRLLSAPLLSSPLLSSPSPPRLLSSPRCLPPSRLHPSRLLMHPRRVGAAPPVRRITRQALEPAKHPERARPAPTRGVAIGSRPPCSPRSSLLETAHADTTLRHRSDDQPCLMHLRVISLVPPCKLRTLTPPGGRCVQWLGGRRGARCVRRQGGNHARRLVRSTRTTPAARLLNDGVRKSCWAHGTEEMIHPV